MAGMLQVLPGNASSKVLGVDLLGDSVVANATIARIATKVKSHRDQAATLGNAQAEMILTHKCLEVSKVGYALRCMGDRVSTQQAAVFDNNLQNAVQGILDVELRDDSRIQATLCVHASGLSLQEASSLLAPAFIASRNAEVEDHRQTFWGLLCATCLVVS